MKPRLRRLGQRRPGARAARPAGQLPDRRGHRHDARRRRPQRGLTINSFASLSLDPPLVLWSLVNRSPNLAVFRDSAHFAINILASGHEALARRFADPAVPDKFADVTVRETPEGVAAIDGALATLVCAHDHCRTVGDHLLLVGQVVRVASQPSEPLVFHAGRFTSVPARAPAIPSSQPGDSQP